jgi:hypothetical protein
MVLVLSIVKILVKIVEVATSSTSIIASIVKSSSHAASIIEASPSSSTLSTSSLLVELILTEKLFGFCEPTRSLLITILPLLRLQSHCELELSEWIFRLSKFNISMSEMAFVSENAILVGLIMSAPFSFIFFIDFILCFLFRLL